MKDEARQTVNGITAKEGTAKGEESFRAERRYRLLAIASHPVQYMAPLLRRMADHPKLDLSVAYCSLRGAEAAHDPDFGTQVKWDVPLLEGYKWTQVPNRGSDDESFWGLNNPGLRELIHEGKFDAVLCFTGYVRASFWIALRAAKRTRAAFLFGTDATTLDSRDGKAWKKWVKKITWPRIFSLADQVIMPSNAGVELMRSLGIKRQCITLTPFVVDNEWWTKQSSMVNRKAVRDSWGVTDRDLVVLFCAKLQVWKRPLDLLRAFAKARVPDAVLVFAGEGLLRAQVETEAAALGVAGRVRFLGFVNQSALPAVYTSADLLVLPSDYDPCPVVVCEAMLCGCPVVLSNRIRGRFDLVRTGETGEIFPCGDVESLAGTLQKLLGEPSTLSLMTENARRRMETWSPEHNIEATIQAIEIAVGRVRGSKGVGA